MTRSLLLALATSALVLGACTVTVVPGAEVEARPIVVAPGESPYVHRELGLRAYPGSIVHRQEQGRNASTTVFEVSAGLDGLYAHFHAQLARAGWQRIELEMKGHKVEADYWRGGRRLGLELKAEGRSGRYRLDTRLENDDDSSS